MFSENYKWNYDYPRLACDSGFTFEKHKVDDFDKNKICLIDIERVIQERDIGTIEKFIPCVTQFILDTEQAQILDETFAKIFRVSQLSIEYLLFCKKYLDSVLVRVKEEITKLKEENQELHLFVEDLKEHVSTLMKEINEKNAAAFRCEQCHKIFSSEDFLNSHIKRRHSVSEIETEKLHLEIKELKGRLNSAEKMIQIETQLKPTVESNSREYELRKIDELQVKFEELRIQVQSELKVLQTQNSFQEKYEQLLEKMAQEYQNKTEMHPLKTRKFLEKVSVEDHNFQETKIEVHPLRARRESTTQTEIDKHQQLQETPQESDLKNEENVLEQQIIEIGGALETKVTSSLEKIETQMQSFWEKLNEMEIHKSRNYSEATKENQAPRSMKLKSKYTVTTPEKLQIATTSESSPETSKNEELIETLKKKYKSEPLKVLKPKPQEKNVIKEVISVPVLKTDVKSDIPDKKITASETTNSDSETISQTPVKEIINKPLSLSKPAVKPKLFEDFKGEVESIVINGRLQDLGVSPEWKCLPFRSFTRALEIVKHQANLMKKTYPDFDLISAEIEKEVAKKVENISSKNKGLDKLIEVKKPRNERKKIKIVSKEKIPISEIKIKNRKMYDTDSESEVVKVVTSKVKENLKEFAPSYSAVIEELKAVTTKTDDSSEKSELNLLKEEAEKPEDQTKGVLKSNFPSVASLTKKKVLFNLENENKDGGSTTSVPSSVLDPTPRKLKENNSKKRIVKQEKDIEDLSDFDFSDM